MTTPAINIPVDSIGVSESETLRNMMIKKAIPELAYSPTPVNTIPTLNDTLDLNPDKSFIVNVMHPATSKPIDILFTVGNKAEESGEPYLSNIPSIDKSASTPTTVSLNSIPDDCISDKAIDTPIPFAQFELSDPEIKSYKDIGLFGVVKSSTKYFRRIYSKVASSYTSTRLDKDGIVKNVRIVKCIITKDDLKPMAELEPQLASINQLCLYVGVKVPNAQFIKEQPNTVKLYNSLAPTYNYNYVYPFLRISFADVDTSNIPEEGILIEIPIITS